MFESGNDCEILEIWKLLKITSHLIHYSTIEKKDQDRDKKPAFSVLDRVIHSSFGPKKKYGGTVKFANSVNPFRFHQVKIPLKSCS